MTKILIKLCSSASPQSFDDIHILSSRLVSMRPATETSTATARRYPNQNILSHHICVSPTYPDTTKRHYISRDISVLVNQFLSDSINILFSKCLCCRRPGSSSMLAPNLPLPYEQDLQQTHLCWYR